MRYSLLVPALLVLFGCAASDPGVSITLEPLSTSCVELVEERICNSPPVPVVFTRYNFDLATTWFEQDRESLALSFTQESDEFDYVQADGVLFFSVDRPASYDLIGYHDRDGGGDGTTAVEIYDHTHFTLLFRVTHLGYQEFSHSGRLEPDTVYGLHFKLSTNRRYRTAPAVIDGAITLGVTGR